MLEDDEAMLEPDVPSVNKRSGKEPTDIADIIADSAGSEQRFNPTFHPNNGPYGRFPAPSIPPATNGRTRRPTTPAAAAAAAAGPSGNNRQAQRTPYANQFEFVDDNSLLGSGNFDVLGGGVFRDTTDYRPYINSNAAQFYPPSPPTQDTFRPNQQFYPLGQPPSQQLGNFAPQPIQQNQPPAYNTPSYPTSFFDDDFFSNFRDFADVNQDYRN